MKQKQIVSMLSIVGYVILSMMLIMVPLVWNTSFALTFEAPKLFLFVFFGFLLFGVVLLRDVMSSRGLSLVPMIDIPIILFTMFYGYATLKSQNVYESMFGVNFGGAWSFLGVLAGVMTMYSVRSLVNTKLAMKIVSRVVVISIFLQIVIGVFQYFGVDMFGMFGDADPVFVGTLGSGLTLGILSIILLVLSTMMALKCEPVIWKYFSFGTAIVSFIPILILSNLELFLLYMVTMLLLVGVLFYKGLLKGKMVFVWVFLGYFVISSVLLLTPLFRDQGIQSYYSIGLQERIRNSNTLVGYDMVTGQGPLMYADSYLQIRPIEYNYGLNYLYDISTSESSFLDLIVYAGYIGAFLFLIVLLQSQKNLINKLIKSKEVYPGMGYGIVFIALSISSFFFAGDMVFMMMFWVFLGGSFAFSQKDSTKESDKPLSESQLQKLIFVGLLSLVFVGYGVYFGMHSYSIEKAYAKVLEMSDDKSLDTETLYMNMYNDLAVIKEKSPQDVRFSYGLSSFAYNLATLKIQGLTTEPTEEESSAIQSLQDLAIKNLDDVIAIQSQQASAYWMRAQARFYLDISGSQKNSDIENDFIAAININSSDFSYMLDYALFLSTIEGRETETEQVFMQALNLKPDYADTYYAIASYLENTKQNESAAYYYNEYKTLLTEQGTLTEELSSSLDEKIVSLTPEDSSSMEEGVPSEALTETTL